MYGLYLLAEDSSEYEILTRWKQIRAGGMCGNESVWMVPGTLNENN